MITLKQPRSMKGASLAHPARSRKPPKEERIVAFEAQERCFWRLRERLAKEYPNCLYVAIHKGKPVLVGNSMLEVADQFYTRFGHEAVYIGRLDGEMDRTELLAAAQL